MQFVLFEPFWKSMIMQIIVCINTERINLQILISGGNSDHFGWMDGYLMFVFYW
jgi:hypothetical protein